MKQGTFWDRIRGRISSVYEWFTRPFLSCDGNRCSGGLDLFVADEEGLFPLLVMQGKEVEGIYVYFCPWCGRRMAQERKM